MSKDLSFKQRLEDREFAVTWFVHTNISTLTLKREYQRGCMWSILYETKRHILRVEDQMIYDRIFEFLNNFLTEDAKDSNEVCDERILNFFAYSYYKLENSYLHNFDDLYDIIIDLGKYDPLIFNSKKYPHLKEKVNKFITTTRNECSKYCDAYGNSIRKESMYKVENPWMVEK